MKQKFHSCKSAIDVGDVNVDKILISDEFFCTRKGYKYFVGYKNDEEITPLCVLLPKLGGYSKYFDDATTMCFLINTTLLIK